MKFKKQIIDEVFKCYSVNAISINGSHELIFAGEGPGVCNLYSGDGFQKKKLLWEEGGGTMSLVSVPEYEGYFFASKGFYSMVDSESSGIYLIRYKNGEFIEEKIADVPYLHRFDVITHEKKRYLIAATLHSGKKDKEDWTNPGKILVAELPYDLQDHFDVELIILKEGITKNHGFSKGPWNNREAVFIASEEGVLAVTPPNNSDDEWGLERIFSHPVSDLASIDLDGDGEVEFALLSPFHGNGFDVYKKIDGVYKSIFQYEKALDFYHGIFADTLNGIPTFVVGARKEDMDLYLVQYDEEQKCCKSILVDTGVGPSNVRIIHAEKQDIIMSANRQINEAAIYIIEEC